MVKLGIICLANDSGLGVQTRRLTYMLKPERVLVIDSTGFSKNKEQHFDWYESFQGYKTDGFPSNHEIKVFLEGLTHVLVCENPLNFSLMSEAKKRGIKVFIQTNYEFTDHLIHKQLELPHKFLMPSHWHVDTMKQKFGDNKVAYLPPPIDPKEFSVARETNLARTGKRRFLHIIGTLAAHDRNGTLDLLSALANTSSDFELLIRSQQELPPEYLSDDRRVSYAIDNVKETQVMYQDFDALILPRRYGGLSLTTNEALMSALPVIMPAISPNDELLPQEWLVDATRTGQFVARVPIDIYTTNARLLAEKIDWLCNADLEALKTQAFALAYSNFSVSELKPKYQKLWSI